MQTDLGTTTGTDLAALQGMAALQSVSSSFDSYDRKTLDTVYAGGFSRMVSQYSYDALGRIECQVQRMNRDTFTALPAACTLATTGADGPDRITRTTYDAVDRARTVTTGYGTAEAATETTDYTANGQTAYVIDANGNRTDYSYDGFDRLARITYPSPTIGGGANPGDYEAFGYDANGNLISRRLRDGQVLAYGYDALNRKTLDDNPNNGTTETDASYVYDNLGRLTYTEDQNGWYSRWSYDALGRVTRQSSNVVPGGTGLQYDVAGRLTRMTWSDGFFVTYEYDQAGAVTLIRENGGAQLAAFFYDDLGRRTQLWRGNNTVTTYSYTSLSQLQALNLDLAGTANDVSFSYSYNPASQINSRTTSNDRYVWTGVANVDRGYGVNGLNQLTAAGGTPLGYDTRGNLTSSGSTRFGYNSRNEMTWGPNAQLLYRNPAGLLNFLVRNDGSSARFDYVGASLTTEIVDGVTRRYVYGPGVDEPILWYEGTGTGDKRWLHADERGSIVAVSDAGGNALAVNTYDEYGIPGAGNLGRFQYTGQKWIAEVGLYDYKARMYSPTLGRFMQTDPIGYGDGLNWYNYVGGDPVNKIDPTGLLCQPGRSGRAVDSNWGEADCVAGGGEYTPDVVVTGGGGGGWGWGNGGALLGGGGGLGGVGAGVGNGFNFGEPPTPQPSPPGERRSPLCQRLADAAKAAKEKLPRQATTDNIWNSYGGVDFYRQTYLENSSDIWWVSQGFTVAGLVLTFTPQSQAASRVVGVVSSIAGFGLGPWQAYYDNLAALTQARLDELEAIRDGSCPNNR